MTKIEAAREAIVNFEAMGFYADCYNRMTEEERAEMSIGMKTRGQYLIENYEDAKARFEYLTAYANSKA